MSCRGSSRKAKLTKPPRVKDRLRHMTPVRPCTLCCSHNRWRWPCDYIQLKYSTGRAAKVLEYPARLCRKFRFNHPLRRAWSGPTRPPGSDGPYSRLPPPGSGPIAVAVSANLFEIFRKMDDERESTFTDAKGIALTATNKEPKQSLILLVWFRTTWDSEFRLKLSLSRNSTLRTQTQAQTRAPMTEMRQDFLLQQPRVKHRNDFTPLANVTGTTIDGRPSEARTKT